MSRREIRMLIECWWKCEGVSALEITLGVSDRHLHIIPSLGLHPEELKPCSHRNNSFMSIEALSLIPRWYQQTSINRWTDK